MPQFEVPLFSPFWSHGTCSSNLDIRNEIRLKVSKFGEAEVELHQAFQIYSSACLKLIIYLLGSLPDLLSLRTGVGPLFSGWPSCCELRSRRPAPGHASGAPFRPCVLHFFFGPGAWLIFQSGCGRRICRFPVHGIVKSRKKRELTVSFFSLQSRVANLALIFAFSSLRNSGCNKLSLPSARIACGRCLGRGRGHLQHHRSHLELYPGDRRGSGFRASLRRPADCFQCFYQDLETPCAGVEG